MAQYVDSGSLYKIHKPKVFLQLDSAEEDPPISAKTVGKYLCDEDGCEETFTREHDVKRHKKTHLDGKALRKEQHPCPITETGCDARMLQFGNLKKHVQSRHPDVEQLVCFKCRPEFQLFHDSVALANHIRAEHRPSQTGTRQKRQRLRWRLGQIPKPPSTPPPRTPRAELPSFITIPMSALPNDDPASPRSPSHRRPEWYRALNPSPSFKVNLTPRLRLRHVVATVLLKGHRQTTRGHRMHSE
ncbi:hypothetical protein IW261DRAFT_1567044 [Armillaria novae-zelandiae]|uniref:C2H2-type domain-containing protein n=1 Tax=Armillaria novae-zelandiae TaxID=153914 RepID=A0AA39P2I0_9AGAR|nr:hypothetical protein IW261DRAFT_1567044 [Armillaria novae-zelandiae]